MTDIVERLRLKARWESIGSEVKLKKHIDWQAADKIEQLRKENAEVKRFSIGNACEAEECWDYTDELKAEIERLREALKWIAYPECIPDEKAKMWEMVKHARSALNKRTLTND